MDIKDRLGLLYEKLCEAHALNLIWQRKTEQKAHGLSSVEVKTNSLFGGISFSTTVFIDQYHKTPEEIRGMMEWFRERGAKCHVKSKTETVKRSKEVTFWYVLKCDRSGLPPTLCWQIGHKCVRSKQLRGMERVVDNWAAKVMADGEHRYGYSNGGQLELAKELGFEFVAEDELSKGALPWKDEEGKQ